MQTVREELKAKARAVFAAADRDLDAGRLTEDAWYQQVCGAQAAAYLALQDPIWQSGFDGVPAEWREAREIVVDALTGDGAFLDVGCANGLLMESVAAWAKERGQNIEPYGLDLCPELAALARQRLPRWADRIACGNVMTWTPPQRFAFVHTGLEYVPARRRPELVRRILDQFLAPDGRLLIGPHSQEEQERATAVVAAAGTEAAGEIAREDSRGGRRYILWVETAANGAKGK